MELHCKPAQRIRPLQLKLATDFWQQFYTEFDIDRLRFMNMEGEDDVGADTKIGDELLTAMAYALHDNPAERK